MKLILVCVVITVAAASRDHHIVIVKSENPTTEYREQDSKGFYSFGYSGDDSAKAEYTTRDGSSKGFYSYIDSDGKLQTVKYEAGRKQGFTASATNLPVQPVDNSKAPEPVTDTPEVEIAKQEHFEAYRDAALQAAMEPENNGDSDDDNDSDSDSDRDAGDNEGTDGDALSADELAELQQNTRELLLSRQNSRDQLLALLKDQKAQQDTRSREREQPSLMTTYILSAQAEARTQGTGQVRAHAQAHIGASSASDSELRTVYRMKNDESNVELKLANRNSHGNSLEIDGDNRDGNDASDNGNNDNTNGNGKTRLQTLYLSPHGNIELHNGEQSYYTVDNPNTHYTVEIPTVLTTLPRIESIRLGGHGHRVPSARSSTYITRRLKSSTH